MSISRVDLNLLVYLDALLREKNVTKAAHSLGITQPAMSNGLKRLREVFNDPILVRSSEGMVPTERAQELAPKAAELLSEMRQLLVPRQEFNPFKSERVFRIVVSDYAEATLFPKVIKAVQSEAPKVSLDLLTPSDVTYHDLEQGKIDLAVNRFDVLPPNFHAKLLWKDDYVCLMSRKKRIGEALSLKQYLQARHIWVSKTGLGVGTGVNPNKVSGWVDQALSRIGQKREIAVYTRHYQLPGLLLEDNTLVATLPRRSADIAAQWLSLHYADPPFHIPPLELQMAWSPLVHFTSAHKWLRRLISYVAEEISMQ